MPTFPACRNYSTIRNNVLHMNERELHCCVMYQMDFTYPMQSTFETPGASQSAEPSNWLPPANPLLLLGSCRRGVMEISEGILYKVSKGLCIKWAIPI